MQWRSKTSAKYRKKLLANKTEAEQMMSDALRCAMYNKAKVREQKVLYTEKSFVLLDFWLNRYRIGVEVDGGYHDAEKDKERDYLITENRYHLSKKDNIQILRFTNEEVITNVNDCINRIIHTIETNSSVEG